MILLLCSAARADEFATLCADRTAVERVYYNHRLGTKPPFEETMPPSLVTNLVQRDLHKETVLRKVYGVEITPSLLATEVRRINTTTRAPEMLAEIKAALGNDSEKFAQVFAKPILVDRLLRYKFVNDAALHAGIRHECEQARCALLAAKTNGADAAQLLSQLKRACPDAVTEMTWQMTARPAASNSPAADETEIKRRFGPDARIISSTRETESVPNFFFGDLPDELQKVLRAQLCKPGDVSAVIETPSGFLLYLVRERTDRTLSVAILSLPKRRYEEWLEQ